MAAIIDQERERLHRIARKWGLMDRRTIRQSKKLDQLINSFMKPKLSRRNQ